VKNVTGETADRLIVGPESSRNLLRDVPRFARKARRDTGRSMEIRGDAFDRFLYFASEQRTKSYIGSASDTSCVCKRDHLWDATIPPSSSATSNTSQSSRQAALAWFDFLCLFLIWRMIYLLAYLLIYPSFILRESREGGWEGEGGRWFEHYESIGVAQPDDREDRERILGYRTGTTIRLYWVRINQDEYKYACLCIAVS